MKRYLIVLFQFLSAVFVFAQQPTPHAIIELWPNGAPTSNGQTGDMIDTDGVLRNITKPTLTVFLPSHPNGMCVMACPGGAYHCVCTGTEGFPMAQWYLNQGIAYAILHYRLPNGHREVPLDDAQRGLQILRGHAKEWGFSKIGIQGCSAGGHLAAMASTHYTGSSNRPDFQILFYPVITLEPSFTHMGTRENLIGKNASEEVAVKYSNEKQVTSQTPPAFIMHSSDDDLVPVKNSIAYYQALVDKGVSATLHVYPNGKHGWAFHDWFAYKREWTGELERWLKWIQPRL